MCYQREPIETFEHAGHTIKIMPDDYAGGEDTNPRACDGNVGVMIAPHRTYTLGDADQAARSEPYARALAAMDRLPAALFPRYARAFLGATVVLPVAMIDHSGLSMWVGSQASPFDPGGWDSGQVGWIFDTPALVAEAGIDAGQVEDCLRAEVKVYDAHLQGNVVGYVVEDADGTEVGSCWGFLIVDNDEDLEYVREQARSEVPA
jgi:hypothetical protein